MNSWTDWAEIFVDTYGWPGGVIGYKNKNFYQIFFSAGNALGPSART